jgi:SAM-dependent methyltransferase
MRWVVVEQFLEGIQNQGISTRGMTLACVGGSPAEPELSALIRQQSTPPAITYFGIEEGPSPFYYLDLNYELVDVPAQYDLVMCSQVLEHVFDVKVALHNLARLCRPGGYLWINCPGSCRAHGSPDFFSSGYSPQLILRLLEIVGVRFETVMALNVGSARGTLYEHVLRRWPDEREFRNPLVHQSAGRGGYLRAVGRWIKYVPQRLAAASLSPVPRFDDAFLGHTCVFVRVLDIASPGSSASSASAR